VVPFGAGGGEIVAVVQFDDFNHDITSVEVW
jgi:hypothetical protein